MMEVTAALIGAFPPSADLLLDRARRQTDDAMLMEIARADYGVMAVEMMAELRRIRDEGVIPALMHRQLIEVLALTRFCDPDVPNTPPFEPGPTGTRGHQTRLFACAALLRAEAEPFHVGVDTSQDSTLAQCLVSAKALGEEMSEAAACFLTWRISRKETCYEPLLFAIGLLILATRLRSGRLTEPALGTIAEWVLAQESLERRENPPNLADPRPVPLSLQEGFWQPLAAELMNEAQAIRNDEVRTDIELCVILMEPGLSW
ncbi:MAG TPA: hypothetical protein VGZ22_16505 [Isosphaeraceae bacterium]|nr:hypothetical protein [Isosphaeraceae bacterium]